MKKYDGRVSSLDTLMQHKSGERRPPAAKTKEKKSRQFKKYLLLFLLVVLVGTVFFFLSRARRNTGTSGDTHDTPLTQTDDVVIKEKRTVMKKTGGKTEKAGAVNGDQPQKSKATVIEKPQTEKSKGPVDFGTSLQLIAPQ